ncbi:MAG: ATP-binding protein [Bacillota bacterium]
MLLFTLRLGGDPLAYELETGWIREALLKRKSLYSPVICFETSDPKRIYQLKCYLLENEETRAAENVLLYDQWDGLSRLLPSPSGPVAEPYRKRVGGSPLTARAMGREGVELAQLRAVLKEVDPYLKSSRSLFIIQNLSESREWETGLQSALRAWAIDPSIIARGSSIVLLTAATDRLLDDFTRELVITKEVDPSSDRERASIISELSRELDIPLDGLMGELVVATAGLNLHQMESILLESYHRWQRFDLRAVKALKSDLVQSSGVLEARDPVYGFSDIGGYQSIKDFVRKFIINVMKNSDRAKRFGLSLPKGILFFGPPGNGKSLFASALATEIQLPFINLVTENIYSKWLGESGQRMKNAIRMAEKMSPAVVFVDEIDRFGQRSAVAGGSAAEETRRVFSQFLEWLGNPERGAMIVGTTNVPGHLDEAFLRTGRLDYKIPFLYPGERARLEVLLVHLGVTPGTRPRAPLGEPEEEVRDFLSREIVPRTKNFSCAELEELVTRGKRVAFDRGAENLAREDFITAARSFRVDHRHREGVIRTCLEQARHYTDDQSFLDAMEAEMEVDI